MRFTRSSVRIAVGLFCVLLGVALGTIAIYAWVTLP